MTPELDRFGKLFIENVRDRSIWQADSLLSGILNGESSSVMIERLRALSPESRAVIHDLIPLIVDDVLFHTLFHLDEYDTIFHSDAEDGQRGKSVEYVHGELAGWLFSDEGWIARYSKERLSIAD
ncbi:hypothetical protein [Deinococcus yunweiensis]|uniref:hypothetical protein n=1 Tax=Deinococcus yunweiensis TaxID=367282 RepID=UPI00398F3D7C